MRSLLFLTFLTLSYSFSLLKNLPPKAGNNFISNVFSDNVVLQREPHSAFIWGWASKGGVEVNLTLDGKIYQASTDSIGTWGVQLDPKPPGGPYTIDVIASDGNKGQLKNVLFGDVWLCGGQSNMQFTLGNVFNATQEVQDAANYPNIRIMTVGQGSVSPTPIPELASIEQTWQEGNPQSVFGDGGWGYFSAVCWLFGRDLYNRDPKVPIGLISSNWGGTYIQTWSSATTLKACNQSTDISNKQDPNQPSVLYNSMIVPFLPMRIRGATWYQGENNVPSSVGGPKLYECLFPKMIKQWREDWQLRDPEFPFFFVQLAPYTGVDGDNLPQMRLAQMIALQVPFVGMGTAIDLGDVKSPLGNIHPRDKQHVGDRLARAARAIAYHERVPYLGPTLRSIEFMGQVPIVTARVHFELSSVEMGIEIIPASCPVDAQECACFDLQLSDGSWHNATSVSIVGNAVDISISNVANGLGLAGVRYLFGNWPVAILFNKVGLPAPPFYASNTL